MRAGNKGRREAGQPPGRDMKLRIVLTDGMRSEDLCFLKHSGSSVIAGLVGDGWHVHYPPDGRVHYTVEEKSNERRKHRVFWPQPGIPLTTFRGMRQLLSMTLSPQRLDDGVRDFKGARQDALVFVDVRAFPADRMIKLAIGLVEPGTIDRLNLAFEPVQLIVERHFTPWVYVAVGNGEDQGGVDHVIQRVVPSGY